MIWILTDEVWAPVAHQVQQALDQRVVHCITLTPEVCRDLVVEIDGVDMTVWIEDTILDLPTAVLYLRDPVPNQSPDAGLGADEAQFVAQQWRIMLRGLVTALEAKGVPVLNSVASVLVDEKTAQLIKAAELGFTTPASLQGASGSHAARFAETHRDRCAVKPFAPFVRLNADGTSAQRLLTNLTNADNLRRGLETATVASPTIVQPFICAPYEHRVVVVGSEVFSARIARVGANAIDVRRLAPTKAKIAQGALPGAVAERCVALVRSYGLAFAAIDLLETSDGDYVFLDLNPSGHFYWVEQVTGAPICNALASVLVDATVAQSQRQLSATNCQQPIVVARGDWTLATAT